MTVMTKSAFFAGIAVLASLPMAASAVTVFETDVMVDQDYTVVGRVTPGDTTEFTFNIMDDLQILDVAIAGTGTNGSSDVSNVTFSRDNPVLAAQGFAFTIGSGAPNSSGAGNSIVAGGSYMAGDTFTISFFDGIEDVVGLTLSFSTFAPDTIAPVPLPAAGGMLLLGMAGLGAIARRKDKAA